METHGKIISGRWAGTRAALIATLLDGFLVRPFNDTAESEDARIHLCPTRPIVVPHEAFQIDKE